MISSRAIRAIYVVCLIPVFLSGCEVHVSDPLKNKRAQAGDCQFEAGIALRELSERIDKDASTGNYPCLEKEIDAAKGKENSPQIAERLTGLVSPSSPSTVPDTTKVSAIGYLMLQPGASPKDLAEANADLLRRVAGQGEEQARSNAIAALSVRRSDADIPVFEAGAKSKDESVLAHSVFALAQNCSISAQKALVDVLRTTEVKAYLDKYRDKESLTSTIRRDCPTAIG